MEYGKKQGEYEINKFHRLNYTWVYQPRGYFPKQWKNQLTHHYPYNTSTAAPAGLENQGTTTMRNYFYCIQYNHPDHLVQQGKINSFKICGNKQNQIYRYVEVQRRPAFQILDYSTSDNSLNRELIQTTK